MMRSIFILTCCLALACVTQAAENENQGKKKKGAAQGEQAQGQAGGKHGKMGRQGQGQGGQALGQGRARGLGQAPGAGRHLNAGQGGNAAAGIHRGAGQGRAANLQAAHANGGKAQIRHFNISRTRNVNIQSVKFNNNYRIAGAEHWGPRYAVFSAYRPQWHERIWWRSHFPRVVLIGGGYYYWNSGFWYPAWGYDPGHAFYPYDGPIYAYNDLPPDQVVANVQGTLKDQGYYTGEIDGQLGPLTRAAIASYQEEHGLATTSAIDQPTMESLGFAS
ncbi:MAG: hypothetical protein QOH39_3638 [Verrucomicrobiota bacterium]|jgi:hypothetical protein